MYFGPTQRAVTKLAYALGRGALWPGPNLPLSTFRARFKLFFSIQAGTTWQLETYFRFACRLCFCYSRRDI